MRETPEDLEALQRLLDASFARASAHLTSIMTPPRRLRADRLVAELPSPAVLNLATVTAAGEPRISAVDGHFLRGHWYFSTADDSVKSRQLRVRPAVSASYTPRDGFGVFCHGRAVELAAGDERRDVVGHFVETYGGTHEDWDGGYFASIDADWLVGFAMTPDEEVAIAQAQAEREARRAAG